MTITSYFLALCLVFFSLVTGNFKRLVNIDFGTTSRTSGITAADVDNDGQFEMIVAVLDGPNLVLKYDVQTDTTINIATEGSPYELLMDLQGRTASVCSCDFDGDGREEIYIHNANSAFDSDRVPDRLYKWQAGSFVDLFSQEWNVNVTPKYGGHSVSCVDYLGNGYYAFLVMTYNKGGAGTYLLLAVNNTHPNDPNLGNILIADVTEAAGLNLVRDGHGIAVGPLLGDSGRSDIIITNDNSYYSHSSVFRHLGDNAVLRNNGNGTLSNVADTTGLLDADANGRAVSMVDLNNDELTDIIFLNELGPNRLLLQNKTVDQLSFDQIEAFSEFSQPGPSSIMLLADFDNDGNLDIFMNGADEDSLYPTKNKLFSVRIDPNKSSTVIPSKLHNAELEKLEIKGISTGDLNGNGRLEMYISHKLFDSRTFSIFEMPSSHNWIRILPQTITGVAAKGARVTVTLSDRSKRQKIVGEGCGYMCHVEPIAHFGLGQLFASEMSIQWPNGHIVKNFLHENYVNKTLTIAYTGKVHIMTHKQNTYFPTSKASAKSAILVYFVFPLTGVLFYTLKFLIEIFQN